MIIENIATTSNKVNRIVKTISFSSFFIFKDDIIILDIL